MTKYVNDNKAEIKEYKKSHRRANRAKNNLKSNNRYKSDIEFKLRLNLRTRLNRALKSNFKIGSCIENLGCSINELKMYLESKFKPGMSWENHTRTGWHIDHIIPLSSFNLSDKEQFKKASHYTNLQPLWYVENIVKRNRI